MIETLKKFKILIIIIVVLVVAFIAYTIYTNASPAADSASLQKTTVNGALPTTTIPGTGSAVPNNELAKSFVDQLLAIQNINLKISFFTDPVFVGLVDNHKGIDPQPIGRPNPFAPIGQDSGQSANNYQDINGQVIKSTTGIPETNGSESTVLKTATSTSKTSATKATTTKPTTKKRIVAPTETTI